MEVICSLEVTIWFTDPGGSSAADSVLIMYARNCYACTKIYGKAVNFAHVVHFVEQVANKFYE